jgi:hypothetical protein
MEMYIYRSRTHVGVRAYHVHVDAVSEEEAPQGGAIRARDLPMLRGEALEDPEGRVLHALSDQAQTQVHSICTENNMLSV